MSSIPVKLARMVKFEHTVFALPFAFMGAVVAAWGIPEGRILLFILLAMVGARTAAMTYNRIADVDIDRKNPRTANRELVTGEISLPVAWVLLFISCALFFYSAYMLNPLALNLSPIALIIILGYSHTKRFTIMSHIVLGASLGIAPVGGWIAATGMFDPHILYLTASVAAWTAGFDIIYSLQDTEFDRKEKLQSLPAVIGEENALWVARGLHAAMVVLLVWFGNVLGLGVIYLFGVLIVGAFLVYEHYLVTPEDKSRINVAFFTVNGFVSIGLFFFTLIDILV